jgi:hypothetical protein
MSNFSRTKLFWQDIKGSNAARIAEKQYPGADPGSNGV